MVWILSSRTVHDDRKSGKNIWLRYFYNKHPRATFNFTQIRRGVYRQIQLLFFFPPRKLQLYHILEYFSTKNRKFLVLFRDGAKIKTASDNTFWFNCDFFHSSFFHVHLPFSWGQILYFISDRNFGLLIRIVFFFRSHSH